MTGEFVYAEKWMRCTIMISLTCLLAHGALAASRSANEPHIETGNDFYRYCRSEREGEDPRISIMCFGFVAGANDMHIADEILNGGPIKLNYCVPQGSTLTQLRDVAIKWLSNRPEKRAELAALTLVEAFANAFPCD